MKQAEKTFLRAVKDADSAFYLRAAAMAADAQRQKRARRFYTVMKHTLKYNIHTYQYSYKGSFFDNNKHISLFAK